MKTSPQKLAYDRAYHAANRERILARKREYWHENKSWLTPTGEKLRRKIAKRRLKTYGLTEAKYAALVAIQGPHCAVCGGTQRLSIDHDHATGKVRGLLCNSCNHALGRVRDDPDRLRRLALYLEHPPFAELDNGERT